jgi:ABC-2 type transport system ATP-binding protein
LERALALHGVRKAFGKTVAVDGTDLVMPRGALYGVIGPKGAGKTT